MSFKNADLSLIAYANGFSLWHYRSTCDGFQTVVKDGYFDKAKSLMNVGDIIIINATHATAIRMVVATKDNVRLGEVLK